MTSELHAERQGCALVLTLRDDTSRNTLSPQIYDAGVEALNVGESDPSLRCVILRGEGRNFCAGGDLKRLAANRHRTETSGPDHQVRSITRFHEWVEAIRTFPKPVIAAVEGAAAGAGFSLALACDLVVAAEDARFLMAYSKIGLTPDGGATWHLMQNLPRAQALRMLWLAEPIAAQQMHTWGLVHQLTPSGRALYEAVQLSERLAAQPEQALAGIKELVNQWPQRPLHEQLGRERDLFVENLLSSDTGEGLQAFFEKRPPQFGPKKT